MNNKTQKIEFDPITGDISFYPWELFENASTELKLHLAKIMSIEEDIQKYILEQVITGWANDCRGNIGPDSYIHKFRETIALNSKHITQEFIDTLNKKCNGLENLVEEYKKRENISEEIIHRLELRIYELNERSKQ